MNSAVLVMESREAAANAGEVELIASRANHPVAYTLEPELIEINPRPCVCGHAMGQHRRVDTTEGPEFYCIDTRLCEHCARTIDQHQRVDTERGPEFYCYYDNDIVTCWELADPRDAWRHAGEVPPKNCSPSEPFFFRKRPYSTPKSTIDAFWHVCRLGDTDHLARWLEQHPRDVAFLQKLWEAKHAGA